MGHFHILVGCLLMRLPLIGARGGRPPPSPLTSAAEHIIQDSKVDILGLTETVTTRGGNKDLVDFVFSQRTTPFVKEVKSLGVRAKLARFNLIKLVWVIVFYNHPQSRWTLARSSPTVRNGFRPCGGTTGRPGRKPADVASGTRFHKPPP